VKLLREYIKKILLTEAMNTVDMLPDDVVIVIKPVRHYIEIYYGKADDPSAKSGTDGVGVHGQIHIMPTGLRSPDPHFHKLGNCGEAWMVGIAAADHGWGPLLYDVAIEWATKNGGGLISDRGSVSDAAQRVWDYYELNRGDVTEHQLDDLANTRTPAEDDNCDQNIARSTITGMYSFWWNSALSKRYTKPPTTMNSLGKKLVEL